MTTTPTKKVIKALIDAKQITKINSLKSKPKKEVKVKVQKQSITELLSLNNTVLTNPETSNKIGDSSIQSVINSCHPDIKLLFNHTNVEKYKINADGLELKLNTGINIQIIPFKTINHTQIFNNIKTNHVIHQTRYIIKDKKGKLILDKQG